MRLPILEVSLVDNIPGGMFCVVLRIDDNEENVRCGIGEALSDALDHLVADIRERAEGEADDRMRKILGAPE
jgi:hypothetical protein